VVAPHLRPLGVFLSRHPHPLDVYFTPRVAHLFLYAHVTLFKVEVPAPQ
jgi:hypothetical protein